MRNLTQYLRLWQQKRSELPVNIDPQADWLAMQSVLDMHMPVVLNGSSGNSGNTGTQLAHVVKFKLLYSAAALIVAASVTYYAVKYTGKQKNKKPQKSEIKKDSLLIRPDSVLADSSFINKAMIDAVADSVNDDTPVKNNTTILNDSSATNAISKATNIDDKSGPKPTGRNSIGNENNIKSSVSKGEKSTGNNMGKSLVSHNRSNNSSPPTGNNRSTRYGNAAIRLNNSLYTVNQGHENSNRNRSATDNIDNGTTLSQTDKSNDNKAILQLTPFPLTVNWPGNLSAADNGIISPANTPVIYQPSIVANPGKIKPNKKTRSAKAGNGLSLANFDWGITGGISTNSEKHLGLFTTYNFNDKWAIGTQVRLFTPYSIKGGYTAPNKSVKDTNQVLQISDSRRIQTADIPAYLIYHITDKISAKAGPVLTIPLKETDGISTFTTLTRKDSTAYYNTVTNALNQTRYLSKINVGITGGVGLNFNRWLFDVTYYQGLQTQQVSSPLGNYTFTRKGVQLTIGFKLNKSKP